jgi:tRNA-splicing ligase RtcB
MSFSPAPAQPSAFTSSVVTGHDARHLVSSDDTPQAFRAAHDDLVAALPPAETIARRPGRAVTRLATTPDFHPGKPVPVGVVLEADGFLLPHMIGNDIGCGMSLLVVDGVTPTDILAARPALVRALRHVHFEGGRDLVLTGRQRRAVLDHGLIGLAESWTDVGGLLSRTAPDALMRAAERSAALGAHASDGLIDDFAGFCVGADTPRRDAVIGSIGGGNHFVEIGVARRLFDGALARAFGIAPGDVAIVVHSGSLDFGQRVGSTTRAALATGGDAADRRILDADAPLGRRFRAGMAQAANLALVNRWALGAATVKALETALGRPVVARPVYDAPHNLVFEENGAFLHRKGACPARGPNPSLPYTGVGEPVILPGSMGEGTVLLAGLGAAETASSAAHGAGRRLSRGRARSAGLRPEGLTVVTPVDRDTLLRQGRHDIVRELDGRLAEEAPEAYRPIAGVVDALVRGGVAVPVARIDPLITVKG